MSAPVPAAFSTTRTHIAGIPVEDLAGQFGTPTYVYDAAMILKRLVELAAFDHVRYAQKACSNLAVLDLLRRHGALVDSVSAGEIRRALAAGYSVAGTPPPIVYTADIFDAEALDLCVERNIHVNCGSPDMIEHLAAVPPADESRSVSTRVSVMATVGRRIRAATRQSTVSGTSRSASAWKWPPGIRSPSAASTCTSARAPIWNISRKSVRRWRKRRWPLVPPSRRSAPGAACRRSIARATAMSIWRPISPFGMPSVNGWK